MECQWQQLNDHQKSVLWELFKEIGRAWNNIDRDLTDREIDGDSANQKSAWLEFIHVKTMRSPSYYKEYENAVEVIEALILVHGLYQAYQALFFHHNFPSPFKEPLTRLQHAKAYVVDEFIRVQVVAGGFRGFGGKNRGHNYNGFVRGSRYNRTKRVRAYNPREDQK